MGFIWCFIFAESDVPMNAEDRFINFWNSMNIRRELPKFFSHLHHKMLCKGEYKIVVIRSVCLEPVARIMCSKLSEKSESFLIEPFKNVHDL